MQIVEFHEQLLPSLTRLINDQIAAIPPAMTLSEAEVGQIIANGGALWQIHFPEDREPYPNGTICVLEHREVVAAAQWIAPKDAGGIFSLAWIVARPESPLPLKTLLHLLEKQVALSGSRSIGCMRFSFGVGWFGLPTAWKHIINGMREAGYKQTQTWVIMHGETEFHTTLTPPSDGLRFYWNMNKPSLEWDVTAFQGESEIGECEVWGIPPHLEDREDLADWATVEWLSIEGKYQRQGFGKRLLAEQMRFHARRGIKHFIAWTWQNNLAARHLNESMGFVYGPELAVMEKP
jgi:GNAT superfamily N-acetyltransferase